ncbi:MAG TPA: HD domain-containing phosphohydrolase, partial [Solirubrobacteraceae bacterium]|nr:HD domain-containing phosphohydrolase [Solirubrobacteraceae bacterium]
MDELMMPLALLDAPSPAAVLVVDDNAGKRLAVRQMLAPLGHAVVEADSGRAAVLAVTQQSFAVILMDVSMPILDGYQTAKLIRERSESASTPIIFLTAYGRDETETASAYASGAVDFIFTPVLAAVLRAKVAAFIHLFVQSRELQRSLESITALNGALHDSEAHTRAVLQNVADGIVTAGETGLIESFNRSAQRLFGYKEFEVIGQPLRLVIAPNADDAASELATTEAVGRRKDGSCFPMEINTSLVNIGERMLTIGCIRDISARNEQVERERERQNTLRRDALRDRLAFEAAPIGGIITARDGTIERVNQAMCDMTGYTADELIGTPCSELAHQDERQHGSVVVDALLSGRSDTERFDQRYLHRSGRIIEARVALTTICDEHDEVAQLFGQIEDVTEARRTSRELEEAQFEMLTRLAAAAEFRDDDTGQHTRRVGDLSVTIAQHLELPEAEIELIRLAAPLHDLGKIAIPDAILGKPGELTVEEYDRMKAHTTIGAEMLDGSPFALLQMAEQIALTHHEKWDGSGYPGGLAGDAIPIAGRIVAVADVFDALTHSRPYKAAWSTADAIAEIESQSGRHFDPRVLEAFLSGSPRAQP